MKEDHEGGDVNAGVGDKVEAETVQKAPNQDKGRKIGGLKEL